jgi:hypothetical protein
MRFCILLRAVPTVLGQDANVVDADLFDAVVVELIYDLIEDVVGSFRFAR